MFTTQGGGVCAYFRRSDLKWLAHKIRILKIIFKLVGREFVIGVLLLCKISRNLVKSKYTHKLSM